MKILRVLGHADPKNGGVVESMLRSALAMPQHKTEILSLDDPDAEFIKTFPLKIHAVGPVNNKFGYTRHLKEWIHNNSWNYDVAIVEGLWTYASFGAAKYLKNEGVPYLLFTHGMMDPWFRSTYPIKHVAKQALWLLSQGAALSSANKVLFTCEEERRLSRTSFWGATYAERVVKFGTARPPPPSQAQRASFIRRCPEVDGKPYLLFMSRIHPKKGCDILLEAFSKSTGCERGYHIVMAGPDQVGLKQDLVKLSRKLGIEDRVHWVGMLTGDEKWGAIRSASALTLFSHQENFGIVVSEALACGTPALISDRVNIWREIIENGAGIAAPDTVKGSQHTLETFFSLSKIERERMRESCLSTFEEQFAIEAAAVDLCGVLESAISENKRA